MFLFNSWNLTNWYHRFDLSLYGGGRPTNISTAGAAAPNPAVDPSQGDNVNIPNSFDKPKFDRNDGSLDSKFSSEQALLHSYPTTGLGLGQNRHVMRIRIFTQNISKFKQTYEKGLLPGNKFDEYKASNASISEGVKDLTGLAVGKGAVSLTSSVLSGLSTLQSTRAATATTRSAARAASASATALSTASSVVGAAPDIVMGAIKAGSLMSASEINMTNTTSTQNLGWISLYMPETLNFVNQQDYDAVELTDALGMAGRISQGGLLGGENLLRTATDLGWTGEKYPDVYLQKNLGYALNPQLQVLYHGPKTREFVFSFRFTPKDPKESTAVRNIIQALRFHAAPEYTLFSNDNYNSRYITPPSQFDIQFLVGNYDGTSFNENTNIPKIGRSVLTNIDVNYAPSGKYATFHDGSPVEILLQLSFTETAILTKDDIYGGY